MSTRGVCHSARATVAISLLGAAALLGGCQSNGHAPEDADPALTVKPADLPSYAEAAPKYNANTDGLERLFVGGAVVRITFPDERGVQQREQVEGTLQLIRPTRLALNIRKVGQPLFWLGCDDKRYWWFDLTGETKYAVLGRHELFRQEQATKIGLSIHPLELVRLIGVMPLPTERGTLGATQWSSDRSLLGISTPLTDTPGGAGGFQRIWVDPATYLPSRIDLLDAQQNLLLTASHEAPASVSLTDRPVGPQLATRIIVQHLPSGSMLDLSMPDASDGRKRISDKAFVFEEIAASLKPDKSFDLDRAPVSPNTVPKDSPKDVGTGAPSK